MSTKFVDYFDPFNKTHISWYKECEKHGNWPKEMYLELAEYDIELPTILDSVVIAGKLARCWCTNFNDYSSLMEFRSNIRNIINEE